MPSYAVIVGGSGALGCAFISHFNSLNFKTVNVDLFPNPQASHNFTPQIAAAELEKLFGSPEEKSISLIVNAAGGWAGGDASDPEFAKKSKQMWEMNVESAILTASLASKHLKSDGLCVFVGAKAVATRSTPDMLAYAMAKSAVASLAANFSVNSPFSVILLLPEVLDTASNRKSMPDSDTSKWTPVNLIAEKVAEFAQKPKSEINGTSWLIITRSGETNFTQKL